MIGSHAHYDILAWLLALLLAWLMYRWQFRDRIDALSARINAGYFTALSGGGLLGAYGFGTWNAWLSGQPGIGRSILGGLVTATICVEIYKLKHGIRTATGAIFAVPFAFALALGRIGCYQSGLDDFTAGTPTELAWGIDFGDGIRRHPVQLYESFAMLATGGGLVAGFHLHPAWLVQNGFYVVAGTYAVQRFAWEFLKPYGSLIGPLNLFHLLCLILMAYAVFMICGGNRERA